MRTNYLHLQAQADTNVCELNTKPKNVLPIDIKTLRRKAKLTQLELAKLVGVSRSAIALYETGKARPSVEVLVALSKILRVDLNEMKQEEGSGVAETQPAYRTVSSVTAIKRIAELMEKIEQGQVTILQAGKRIRTSQRAIDKAQAEIKQMLGWQGITGEGLSDGG